jgi:pectin methylesterase-like acyl-CoA thioesterase
VRRGAIALCAVLAACAEPGQVVHDASVDAASAGVSSDAGLDAARALRDGSVARTDGDFDRELSDAAGGLLEDARSAPEGTSPDAAGALPSGLQASGVRALFPMPGSDGVCPDPALRISFTATPKLGSAGVVQLFDVARPDVAVLSIDMSEANATVSMAGVSLHVPRPAYLDGDALVLPVPAGALAYGHEYFVRLEAGVVMTPGNAALSISDDLTWRFRTQRVAPRDPSQLSVALDGSGDFCSLQGALDALAVGGRVTMAQGTYFGPARARGKRDITLSGADRKATILTGTNNEQLNSGTSKRALISIEDSSGVVIENLTIHNRTPQGGSQAEALRLERCDKCVVRDADLLSLQDTLLWSGRIYASNALIAGNVDFIWGTGAAYFEHCEIRTLGRKGYTVQARNASDGYGFVFVDCKLTAEPGITGHFLGRIDASAYPASHVAYIDCELGEHIDPAGFLVSAGDTSALRFWEYQSVRLGGGAVDLSRRAQGVRQLSSDEAARMRDAKVVLGGWTP